MKSVAGTKGSEQGERFVLEDPRTVFYFPDDRQVIVYLEWEGTAGPHRLEGRWKNPDGKPVVFSDIEYFAKQTRFGAYWTLTLSDGVLPGLWALEAYIDGELAGAHNFQIVLAPRPANQEFSRRPLTPAEIYKLALGATLELHKLGPQGTLLDKGSGFLVKGEYFVTSFDAMDGAQSLEVVLREGTRIPIESVWAWNRRQDWAVLHVPGLKAQGLSVAKPDSWAVGDSVFSLDVPADGSRTIVKGAITGIHDFPEFGPRVHLSFTTSREASGSPVLNEYGEVIGMFVHDSVFPGSWSMAKQGSGYPGNLVKTQSPFALHSVLAVPIRIVAVPLPSDAKPRSIAELAQSGLWMPNLITSRNVWRGTAAVNLDKKRAVVEPVDEKFEFSRRDKQILFLVSWNAQEKLRTQYYYRAYDIDNRLLAEGKPSKLKLNIGQSLDTSWTLDLAQIRPGFYRTDVILGTDVVWRTFFRVVD